jgi:hypothetical protein
MEKLLFNRIFTMYNFETQSIDGIDVSYCVLPYHAIDKVARHDKLTPTAKSAFFVLLSYASYKASESFYVTATWISERLSITRKTASTALTQLKEFGFATDNGIIVPALDSLSKRRNDKQPDFAQTKLTIKQKRQQKNTKILSEQNNGNANAAKTSENFVRTKKPEPEAIPQAEVTTNKRNTSNIDSDILSEQNTSQITQTTQAPQKPSEQQSFLIQERIAKLESLFGVGRVPQGTVKGIIDSVMSGVKTDQPEVKITHETGKNYPPHITNLKTSFKNNIPEHEQAPNLVTTQNTGNDVGMFSNHAKRGNVEIEPTQQARALRTRNDSRQTTKNGSVETAAKALHGGKLRYLNRYMETALQRMRVGAGQIEVYMDEITFSLTKGAFAETFAQCPMKAVRACLNIVEAGKWRPNAGMY